MRCICYPENGYASVMMANHSFFYVPVMVVGEDYPEGTAEDKGLAGALKYMRSFWGERSPPALATGVVSMCLTRSLCA